MEKLKFTGKIAMTLLILLGIVMFPLFNIKSSAAYATFPNNAKLIGGVGNYGDKLRYYWISSSAESNRKAITDARNSWVRTSDILSTSIDIGETTVQSNSVIDIHKYVLTNEKGFKSIYAMTYFYTTSNASSMIKYDPVDVNYKWAKIVLNGQYYDELKVKNSSTGLCERQGVVAHELGHAFGLAHSTSKYRIMSQFNTREVDTPQKEDLKTINYLYD